MSSTDLYGRIGLAEMGDTELSPGSEPNGKGSKSNFLEGLLGQASFIATEGLWTRTSGSSDSAETFGIPSIEFAGSPRSARSRSPLSSARSRSPFSTATGESDVDRLIADLKEENDNLRYELDTMQQREFDLGFKLELAEDRLRKEIVMFEENASNASVRSGEESRDDNSSLGSGSRSSKRRTSPEIRESTSNFELQYSFTQSDEFQFTKERLAETEEKLRVMTEKASKAVQPQELEAALARAAEAERKLVEREDDMVQLYKFTEDLEEKHEELQGKVIIHKKEADDLRHQLAEKQQELEENVAQRLAAESEVAQWEKQSAEISSLTDVTFEQKECSFESSRELRQRETEQMATLRDENAQLQKAVAELTRKSAAEQSHAEGMEKLVQALKSEVKDLKAQLRDTVSKCQESEESFAEIHQEAKSRISELQRENMKLRETMAEVEQQCQIERSFSQEEHFLDLHAQVEEMSKAIESLQSEVDERSSQLLNSQTSLSEKSKQLQAAETELAELKAAKSKETVSLQQEKERLTGSLVAMEEESQRRLKGSHMYVEDLKAKVNEMSGTIQALKLDVEERKTLLSEHLSTIEQKSKQIEIAGANFSRLEQENLKLRDTLADTEKKNESDLNTAVERLVEMQIKSNEMKDTIRALESEVDEHSNQLLESQAELSDKLKKLEEAEVTFAEEVEALKGLRDTNEELRGELGKSKHHAQIDLLEAKGRIEELQSESEAMTSTIESLRSDAEETSAQMLEYQKKLARKALLLEEAEEALRTLQNDNVRLKESLVEAEEKGRCDLQKSEERVTDLQTQVEAMTKEVQDLQYNVEARSLELKDSEVLAAEKSKQLQEAESRASLANSTKQLEDAEASLTTVKLQLKESLEETEKKRFNGIKASQARVTGLKTQVDEMTKTIEPLQTDVEAKEAALQESEASSAEKSKQLQELEAELADTKDSLVCKSTQLEEAENSYAALQQEAAELRKTLAELEEKSACDLKSSQDHVTELQLQVDDMTRAMEALQNEADERSSELVKTEASLADKSKQLQDAETQLAHSQESPATASKQLGEVTAASTTLREENSILKESLAEAEKKSELDQEASRERHNDLQAEAFEMVKSIEALKEEIGEKSSKIITFEVSLAEKSKKLDQAGATLAALCQENINLKANHSKSEQMLRRDSQEAQERVVGLQAQVAEMENMIRSLQGEVGEKNSALLNMQSSLEETSKQLQYTKEQYKTLRRESLRHDEAFAEAEKQSGRYVAASHERFAVLQNEADEMAEAMQSLQKECDTRSSQLDESRTLLAEKSKRLEEIESTAKALEQEKIQLKESLAQATQRSRDDAVASQERIDALQAQLDEVNAQAKTLRATIEQQASQLDEGRTLLAEKSRRLEEMELTAKALEQEKVQLKELLAEATQQRRDDSEASQERIDALQAQFDEANAQAKTLRATIEQQASQLDEGRSLLSEKSTQLQEVEARVSRLRQKNKELSETLAHAEERALRALHVQDLGARAMPSIQSEATEKSPPVEEGGVSTVGDSKVPLSHNITVDKSKVVDLERALMPLTNLSIHLAPPTDEMTKTIQALRSQVEERTIRLLERKRGFKKLKHSQQAGARQESHRVSVEEWKRRSHDAQSARALRGELLHSLQKDMEQALATSRETIHRLEQEVGQWKKVASETEKTLENCRSEFSKTKEELQKIIASLDEALAREEALNGQVSELEKSRTTLVEELASEKQLREEALASVDKKLETMRQAYEAVIEELKETVSNELNEANEEVSCLVEMHDALLKDHAVESNQFADALASYKQMASSSMTSQGLPDIDEDAELPADDEIEVFRSATTSFDFESCGASSSQLIQMSELNKSLLDAIEEMKEELKEVQEENDNLQRQLSAKFGLFNKVQGQFEMLQKEYNSVLIENRALRKDNSSMSSLQKCVVSAITGSTEALTTNRATTAPALTRKESEIKIESLTNEKRELVKRSSSAISDMQKAEQEAWKANQIISKLKKELRAANMAKRALQLALESKNRDTHEGRPRDISIPHVTSDESCKENEPRVDDGTLSMSKSDELLVTDGDSRLPLATPPVKAPQGDPADSKVKKDDAKTLACGSELLVNDGIKDEASMSASPSATNTLSLKESPSEASEESAEIECTLSLSEHGAELLISDGSSPALSWLSEMTQSVSEDESIEEVECTLGTTDMGATVMVNDRPLPSSSTMIMVGVGGTPVSVTTIAPPPLEEPSIVEARVPQDTVELERQLATAAMVAKLLSQHEIRYMHEAARTAPPPILKRPSRHVLVDSKPRRPLVWKGYYESEHMNDSRDQQEEEGRIIREEKQE